MSSSYTLKQHSSRNDSTPVQFANGFGEPGQIHSDPGVDVKVLPDSDRYRTCFAYISMEARGAYVSFCPTDTSAREMNNLTGKVRKSEKHYFAIGGLADVWKGEWTQETAHSNKAAVVSGPILYIEGGTN
jgi:hypothetical protein